MQAELVVSNLLNVPAVTDIVGDKRALARLAHNTHLPALVYNVVSDVPNVMVDYSNPTLYKARVQINPLAKTVAEVKSIQDAIAQAMNFKQNVKVGEALVVWCRLDLTNQMDKNDETAVWTQAVDYLLDYYPQV